MANCNATVRPNQPWVPLWHSTPHTGRGFMPPRINRGCLFFRLPSMVGWKPAAAEFPNT